MSEVQRLGHVAIRVNDMERAIGFYTDLGMRMVREADDWYAPAVRTQGDGLALLGPNYKAAGPHFAFHFRDRAEVDVVHARLKASGVAVEGVHDHRDGTASFYLRDPEGNWLEMLYEPLKGFLRIKPGGTTTARCSLSRKPWSCSSGRGCVSTCPVSPARSRAVAPVASVLCRSRCPTACCFSPERWKWPRWMVCWRAD